MPSSSGRRTRRADRRAVWVAPERRWTLLANSSSSGTTDPLAVAVCDTHPDTRLDADKTYGGLRRWSPHDTTRPTDRRRHRRGDATPPTVDPPSTRRLTRHRPQRQDSPAQRARPGAVYTNSSARRVAHAAPLGLSLAPNKSPQSRRTTSAVFLRARPACRAGHRVVGRCCYGGGITASTVLSALCPGGQASVNRPRMSSAVIVPLARAPPSTTWLNSSRLRCCRATTFSSMVSWETRR